MTTLQDFTRARAEIDKQAAELAERKEARFAELLKHSNPNGRSHVIHDGPSPRKLEIKSELKQIEAAIASLDQQRAAILEEEEPAVRASMEDAADTEYRKLGPALAQVFSSLRTLETMKVELQKHGFGFWGKPIKLDTERVFPESTFNRGSDLIQLVRKCAELGFAKLPKEIA